MVTPPPGSASPPPPSPPPAPGPAAGAGAGSDRAADAYRDAPLGSWRKVYLLVALFAVAWMLLLWWLTDAFNVRLPR